ncbi:MAG TPA: hypothetical protein PKD72_09565, partial [Gemmatales bacterium]|nr:hypothetical protein [Gemmatales bacterium]
MELAHYATDKVSSGLLAVYQNLWQALKQKRVSLLELGVAQGGSLRIWADFFAAESRLYGVGRTLPSGVF